MADERHVERGRHLKAARGGREQDQAAMQGTRKELWLRLGAAWPCVASSVCLHTCLGELHPGTGLRMPAYGERQTAQEREQM